MEGTWNRQSGMSLAFGRTFLSGVEIFFLLFLCCLFLGMPKSKIAKEFQADEEGTVLVPKEIVSVPETAVKKAVKREMSEKQRENMVKMVAANKEKWAKQREERAKALEDERTKRIEEEKKLVEAGTHVRVKVTKKQYKPRVRKDSPPAPLKLERQNGRYKPEESESETEDTEADTEVTESEYEEERPKARQARREMKKTLRVVEKVDAVLNQVQNPYLSMLSNRWR
jgi:hypothetical protein